MGSGSGKKQNKLLSLDEVISAVLESYDDDLSDNDESDSDIGDFEDDEGNQELFILNTQKPPDNRARGPGGQPTPEQMLSTAIHRLIVKTNLSYGWPF